MSNKSSPSVRLRIPLLESGLVALRNQLAGPGRELAPHEQAVLIRIFGQSVYLDRVLLASTSVGANGRAYAERAFDMMKIVDAFEETLYAVIPSKSSNSVGAASANGIYGLQYKRAGH